MRWAVVLVVLLSGCAESGREAGTEAEEGRDTPPSTMPEFPAVSAGRLAALTGTHNEEYQFSGSWEATAHRCQDPALVQVVAQGDGIGVVVLLGPPPAGVNGLGAGAGAGAYDVVLGDRDIPDTATARVGVQLFAVPGRQHVFQGTEGTVEVEGVNGVLVGRMAIRAIESSFRDTTFLAGSFEVPLENASDEWCQVLGGRRRAAGSRRTPVRSRGASG